MDAEARAALDALIRERREDYASLSKLIGRNPAYIQQFIKRGVPKKLDEDDRRKLARYLGVAETLLGGPATAPADDLISVPVFDVRASAGPGTFADDERARARMRFDPGWLRGLNVTGDQLSVIQVMGDSMKPTLEDGDDILVDRGDRRLRDGIYVLRMDGTLNVKRVTLEPGQRIAVRSDNSDYPSRTGLEQKDIDIIGRVVWAGRRLG